MKSKIIHIGLIGKTNAGKSTFINSIVQKKISIVNKKINTTSEITTGVLNIKNIQIIFYDTPGFHFLKKKNEIKKKQNTIIWELINNIDVIFFFIDTTKFIYNKVVQDITKIKESKKPVVVIFNKIDLIKNEIILPYINELNKINLIDDFFNISAKFSKNYNQLIKYLMQRSKYGKWQYTDGEISNQDNVFITNECTRNALLYYLHKEIPYNIVVKNKLFKFINKENIKIKQFIEINNIRYKSIILGKKGNTIKKIRELSQNEIKKIFNSKIHLYLEIVHINAK